MFLVEFLVALVVINHFNAKLVTLLSIMYYYQTKHVSFATVLIITSLIQLPTAVNYVHYKIASIVHP